ncbi:uncharacterized protein B0T23DRAFT_455135 [Neurospora hispaniola]|uniref:Uncharacterized protein n=1 Tax=Neurospora hispaniola TaxID=588809 RepID=A0AAJ0I3G5_9PEZI|nr:hypothetical protein B0T23DRAFT_455135 [Neurospora hispaniola]
MSRLDDKAHQGGKDWRLVQDANGPLRLLNAALDSTVSQQLHRVVDMPLGEAIRLECGEEQYRDISLK